MKSIFDKIDELDKLNFDDDDEDDFIPVQKETPLSHSEFAIS